MTAEIESHVLSVLVDNETGVLAKVAGLFSARGYNISGLTVAEVSEDQQVSRITVVTSGTPHVIEQIKAQLEKLVPVHAVQDLTTSGAHVERELLLIKVQCEGNERVEALRLADIFRARAVDSTLTSFIFELTGVGDKLQAFIELMKPLGMTEVARSGIAGMMRGTTTIEDQVKKAGKSAA